MKDIITLLTAILVQIEIISLVTVILIEIIILYSNIV